MTGPLPNFLVIGATRAGSTALHHYLDVHPDVFLPSRKEIRFFNVNFDKGVGWYRDHFVGVGDEHAIGEATPSYLYRRQAIERIVTTLPDVRLVAVLRHPVDRAYSHYWMNRRQGREHRSFDQVVNDELVGAVSIGSDVAGQSGGLPFEYLGPGRYLPQLQTVCEHLNRERLLVLLFDDLCASPATTYRSVCKFLGIDDDFVPANLGQPLNVATEFRSLSVRRLARRLQGSARPLGRALAKLNQQPARNPPMDPATRGRLVAHFREDNAALAIWLGLDLSAWDR